MDPHIYQILLQHDSATDVEFPPGFDWQASMAAVKSLKPEAERILGEPLKLDDRVQDASFFTELFLLEKGVAGVNGEAPMVFKIGIRFSTFGKMATIHTNSPASVLSNSTVDRLAELLNRAGFQYIPVEALAERYDGKVKWLDQSVGGEATWWFRFFDYM